MRSTERPSTWHHGIKIPLTRPGDEWRVSDSSRRKLAAPGLARRWLEETGMSQTGQPESPVGNRVAGSTCRHRGSRSLAACRTWRKCLAVTRRAKLHLLVKQAARSTHSQVV